MQNLLKVGITGGIGSGKSTVCRLLERNSYRVLYADEIAKELLDNDREIRNKILDCFGPEYFQDGKPNKKLIADNIFSDTQKLQKINSILHPPVIKIILEKMREAESEKIIFVEAALIYEAGMEDLFDYIIVITADESTRIERTAEQRAESEDSIRKRIQMQISEEDKIGAADFVIHNNGTEEELEKKSDFIVGLVLKIGVLGDID